MPLALLVAFLVGLAQLATAATFDVTSNLDSGPGTLRQAILDANADSTLDTIAFSIDTGPVTIALATALPDVINPVTIDGTTQPGFVDTPLVEIDGEGVPAGGSGITLLDHTGSTIRGLVIDRFPGDNFLGGNGIVISGGGGHTIEGNYLGTDAAGTPNLGNGRDGITVSLATGCTIGGTTAAARNLISGNFTTGVRLTGASSNMVLGNWIGVAPSGSVSLGNGSGVLVLSNGTTGSVGNVIGGDVAAAANVISSNSIGVIVGNEESSGNTIKGNLIGTDSTGAAALGNTMVGIRVNSAPAVTIDGNVVAGSPTGIEIINLGSDGTVIRSNAVGTDPSGTLVLGNGTGIRVAFGASGAPVGTTIGGAAVGNVIAHNGGAGVAVLSGTASVPMTFVSPTAVEIRDNAIFANGGLGIDLEEDGVTPNDALDADGGANGLTNFPVVTGVVDMGDMIEFIGTLDAAASTTYRVELFSNTAADPSGNGEGEGPLGTTMVTTDLTGHGAFDVLLPVAVSAGQFVTATATTDPGGDTSEFSAAFEVGATTTTTSSTTSSTSTSTDVTTSSTSTSVPDTTTTTAEPTTTSTSTLESTTSTVEPTTTSSTTVEPTTTSSSTVEPTTTSSSTLESTTTSTVGSTTSTSMTLEPTTTTSVTTTTVGSTTLPAPSTTTTTTASTTTTTLPCSMSQPLSGIACRINALSARVGQESALGPVAAKLQKQLEQAGIRTEEARESCLIGKAPAAKKKLGKASKALVLLEKVLRSKKAKTAPQSLRDEITGTSEAIRSDVGLIRIALACP